MFLINYLIQIINHPKESSIHQIVFEILMKLLDKDDIKIVLQSLNSIKGEAYSNEESNL